MNNLTVLPTPSPLQKQIEMSFEQWILKFGKRLLAILGGGVLLTVSSSAYKAFAQLNSDTEWRYLLLFITSVQFGVIFLAVLFSSKLPQLVDEDSSAEEPTLSDTISPHEEDIMKASGYTDLNDWRRAKLVAVAVLDQFKNYWMAIWICWLCLYFLLAILYIPGNKPIYISSSLD